MNLDLSIVAKWGYSKIKNRMAYSIDPDEMARYKLSRLDQEFAKVYVLICRTERVKVNGHMPKSAL